MVSVADIPVPWWDGPAKGYVVLGYSFQHLLLWLRMLMQSDGLFSPHFTHYLHFAHTFHITAAQTGWKRGISQRSHHCRNTLFSLGSFSAMINCSFYPLLPCFPNGWLNTKFATVYRHLNLSLCSAGPFRECLSLRSPGRTGCSKRDIALALHIVSSP